MEYIVTRAWVMPLMVNCFSLIVLFILLSDNHGKHHETKSQKYRYFQYIVLANMLLLVLDGITWLVAGAPGNHMRTIHMTASVFYYELNPVPSYFFLCFVDETLSLPAEKKRIRMRWYTVPIALNFLMTLATPFTGWFFQIDIANIYHRGSLLAVSFFLSYVLMVFAFFKVLVRYIQSRKENKEVARTVKEYGWMLKFTAIPILGGIVQVFDYSVTYVWSFTTIALLILYINYQNDEITTDTLTGLYNRRQAFVYFDRFVRERERSKASIALVMMDINNFKAINDNYGHSMGDEAITAVARALEAVFEWDDFICRFGGDEFVVITKHGAVNHLKAVLDRVNEGLLAQQEAKQYPFELSLSAGYALYSQRTDTMDAMFKKADEMMFEQKARLMRRASDKND